MLGSDEASVAARISLQATINQQVTRSTKNFRRSKIVVHPIGSYRIKNDKDHVMMINIELPVTHSVYRVELQKKTLFSQKQMREKIEVTAAKIIHRTQAKNHKSPHQTFAEEQAAREHIMSEQVKAWRSMLPILIKKFSRIPDPRRAKSVKRKLVVLMIFGLLAFVFRLSSRREMNRELTGATINNNLRKIFPEFDSIPHADTLARILEIINSKQIEDTHLALIKDLIRKKKFKKLLIHGCLPISVDGAQKSFRDGILHDSYWLQRTLGKNDAQVEQQFFYAIEANITLKKRPEYTTNDRVFIHGK